VRLRKLFILLLLVASSAAWFAACDFNRRDRIRQFKAELESARYELDLCQDQLEEMQRQLDSHPRPGTRLSNGNIFLGFSRDWIQRRNTLKEEETRLLVKIHELETKIRMENEQP